VLTEYIKAALKRTEYKKLEDGTWFAEIIGFQGVWANAESVEACRNELREVLEEWLMLKIRAGDRPKTLSPAGSVYVMLSLNLEGSESHESDPSFMSFSAFSVPLCEDLLLSYEP
jgi:predicted RNase H-like HicB family nuclease